MVDAHVKLLMQLKMFQLQHIWHVDLKRRPTNLKKLELATEIAKAQSEQFAKDWKTISGGGTHES